MISMEITLLGVTHVLMWYNKPQGNNNSNNTQMKRKIMHYDITDYFSIILSVNWNLDSDDGDLMPDEFPPEHVEIYSDQIDEFVKYADDDAGGIDTYLLDEAIMIYLSDTYGFDVNEFDIEDYVLKSDA